MTKTKYVILAILLLISNMANSQSDKQLHKIKPKWKLGDVKKIHTVSFTKVFIKDSLFNKTEATADYRIKVVDTTKFFTIQYSSDTNSINIKSTSTNTAVDSAINIFTSIFKTIEEEVRSFQYEIVVDKNTGQALKVKNSDKLLESVETITSKVIDDFGKKTGKTTDQIDSVKQQVVKNFKLKEPKFIETILNEFNYIMGAYSLTFPYNSSTSQKAMVHDVNAMGEFGDIEMPAIITTSSKKTQDSLIVQTDTDYDKDFLLEQIKKKYKSMNNLTTSDIYLSEKTEASFTTTTNWIVSHISRVVFKTKEVQVINETQVSIK